MLLRLVFLTISLSCPGLAWAEGESILMPGKVIEGHAKLEPNCKECHVRFNKEAQHKLCMDCHKEVGADVLNHKGFHGKLSENKCRDCHTDHKGRGARIVVMDANKFDHAKTDFPLLGAHQKKEKVKCKDCHDPRKKYREAPLTCNGCHLKDDKHKGSLGDDCGNCHIESNWKKAKFDHSKTKFAVKGKHLEVPCKKCHAGHPTNYKGAPLDCLSCHRKDDKHKGKYGKKCETCHVDRSWKKIEFDHDGETKFKLLGKHELVKCMSCHKQPLFGKVKTPATCIACHKKQDVHKGKLGKQCETCHDEKKWKGTRIDHGRTRFPLLGMHLKVECRKCHQTKLYRDTPSNCYSCHRKDDVHKLRLGKKCDSCHNARSWQAWDFDHDKRTSFKLDGAHKKLDCYACHIKEMSGRIIVPLSCAGCHDNDDVHQGEFGQQCERCHVTSDFKTLLMGSSPKRR